MDRVRLIDEDLDEVDTDPDTEPKTDLDCDGIDMRVVMNSVVSFRASRLDHDEGVERVTRHPPGSTNFASGMAAFFAFIFSSANTNPSRSEIFLDADWSSSLFSRTKLAKEVTGDAGFELAAVVVQH